MKRLLVFIIFITCLLSSCIAPNSIKKGVITNKDSYTFKGYKYYHIYVKTGGLLF